MSMITQNNILTDFYSSLYST